MVEFARILFVDDDLNLLKAMQRSLRPQQSQWDMLFLDCPSKALDLLKCTNIHVLVTDFRMPGIDGIELIKRVQRIQRNTGFILLTGSGDYSVAKRALNSTVLNQLVDKPCETTRLVSIIKRVLGEARLSAQDEKQSVLAHQALNSVPTGIAVLSGRSLHIVYANNAMKTLMSKRDGILKDELGSCRAISSGGTEMLKSAVASLCENAAGNNTVFLSLPRQSMKRDLAVSLRRVGAYSDNEEPAIILQIRDPDCDHLPDAEGLGSLFGLTSSEAAITLLIAQGKSVQEAAEARGLKADSVRTYLKRAFAKTGVSSQSELVRLVLTGSS